MRPPPPKIGKKYDFLAQNRDFSHEIPQIFSRLPPLGAIFLSASPPNLKFWIRPCISSIYISYYSEEEIRFRVKELLLAHHV